MGIVKDIHISSHASEQTESEIQIVRSHLNSFVPGYSKMSVRARPQQTRQHFKCCIMPNLEKTVWTVYDTSWLLLKFAGFGN